MLQGITVFEYKNYQGKPEQIHNRSLRNQARRDAADRGMVHKGDGMDVDHKKPLIRGGGNGAGNLRVQSKSSNRSFPRTRTARMKAR